MKRFGNKLSLLALVAMLLLGGVDAWGFGITRNVGLNLKAESNQGSWNASTKKLGWKASYSNLYFLTDLSNKNLSGCDKITVVVSDANNQSYRLVVRTGGVNYTAAMTGNGTKELSLKNSFKDGNKTVDLTNKLSNVESVRIGGNSGSGSITINSISFHKNVDWDSNGKITFTDVDFNLNSATYSNGTFSFRNQNNGIYLEFDDNNLASTDIQSTTLNITNSGQFFQTFENGSVVSYSLQDAQNRKVGVRTYRIVADANNISTRITSVVFTKNTGTTEITPKYPTFDYKNEAIFFEDFENLDKARANNNKGIENVTDAALMLEYANTPGVDKDNTDPKKDYSYMQGKYLNYGGRGEVLSDPTFGKYYQNLSDADEYTKSIAENFLRIILDNDQRRAIGNAVSNSGAATIGFWINGQVAVDYELPLERGSMFTIFSNMRFRKADNYDERPRFMFDLACNGWTYTYLPNSDGNGKTIGENMFFYEEKNKNTATNPRVSLFGEDNYLNTLDQSKYKFYNDRKWHYVSYVMENNLRTVKVYLDGELTGTIEDVTDSKQVSECLFSGNNDFKGRVQYLRNIVLGGFTPHGLFYDKQYYSDAALAYDDIAIFGKALTKDQIKSIIEQKGYNLQEWNFGDPAGVKGELQGENTGLVSNPKYDDNNYLEVEAGQYLTIPAVQQNNYIRIEYKFADETKNVKPTSLSKNLVYVGNRVSDDPQGKDQDFDIITFKANASANYQVKVNSGIIIKSVVITPYQYADLNYSKENVKFQVEGKDKFKQGGVEVDATSKMPTLSLRIDGVKKDIVNGYKPSNKTDNCYIKYTSTAPHVAHVNEDGKVTVTGIAGNAFICAEVISDNLFIGSEYVDTFEVIVTKVENTLELTKGSKVSVGDRYPEKLGETSDKKLENITLTVGGWAYTKDYAIQEGEGDDRKVVRVTDGWNTTKQFVKSGEILDGFDMYSLGKQDAKSESYGMNDDFDAADGKYAPNVERYLDESGKAHYRFVGIENNKTPWTLPCRGSYVKFEPVTAGIVTMYILQDGNLEKDNAGDDHSSHVLWKPVYITDETGKVVEFVQTSTKGRIGDHDNFFIGDKRRAQFIEGIATTYNEDPTLRAELIALRDNDYEKFETLVNNWANAGWTQKVIKTNDGGYMVMSTAIVRYTFNVNPGKTYYLFSNDSRIGISGFNFEEGRLLDIETENYAAAPVRDVVATEAIDYTDNVNDADPVIPADGKDITPVSYTRNFYSGKWSSICLPFSMNNRQMREQFGDSTAVVLLKEIHDDGKIELIWHVNQDIIAGYPYFILPRGEIKNANVANSVISKITANVFFDKNIDKSNPLFSVGSTSETFDWMETYSGANYKADYPYVFEGNFRKAALPAGSYVMANNGVLTKITKATTAKPFRAYLKFMGSDASKAKPLYTGGFSNSNENGEATGIDELLFQNGILTESTDVYGIDGTIVSKGTRDLSNLKKGVYVLNGKKFVK